MARPGRGVEAPSHLRRHPRPLALMLLAALVHQREREITDSLVELFIATAHRIGARVERPVQIKTTQRTSIALRGTAPSAPDLDLVVTAVCLDPDCAAWAGWAGEPAWELVYDGPAGPVFTDRKNRTENPGNGQWTISLTRLRGLAPDSSRLGGDQGVPTPQERWMANRGPGAVIIGVWSRAGIAGAGGAASRPPAYRSMGRCTASSQAPPR